MALLSDYNSCYDYNNTVDTKPTGIQKGSSIPFVFDRDGLSIDGWICTISVKQFPGDVAIINRTITPTGCAWSGFLTSTETDTLDEGKQYFIIGVLTHAANDEEEKPPVKFYLGKKWA